MPPKVKISKEDIINAAFDIVRNLGAQSLNARDIASHLNCSTQPIFSNFQSMEQIRLAVVEKADALCNEYIKKEIESKQYPPYKASGMAYIRFAKEERELFKLLYMRDRSDETFTLESDVSNQMEDMVRSNTGIGEGKEKLFHLEMWAFVHGIASMFATRFVDLDWELVSQMITDTYQGLIKQYGVE